MPKCTSSRKMTIVREMDRLLQNNFAKEEDSEPPQGIIWYLLHFGVRNINKPGKVRLVFDAATKTCSISFNDLLLSGPHLLKPLPGVIMRFRRYSYAIKANLRNMFLNIRKENQSAQRFL